MTADVDEDPVGLALAVEAGAAGAEDDGDPGAAAVLEDLGDVAGVVRHHHRPRQQPVGAGVGGVADDVAGAGEDAVGAEQRLELAAQRLRGPRRELVRGAVGGGLRGGRREISAPAAPSPP